MKLNLGKRLILFVYWLASLIVLAMLTVPQYTDIAIAYVKDLIPAAYMQYAVIGVLSVYLLLSLSVLCMIFKRGKVKRSERGFITVDSADSGKVRISISAIEQMVKQAAHTVDGIADMKISITNTDDAIAIGTNVTMISGSHVPTVTLNLQRAIRQYVEMNSGVAVRSVSVSIQSVTNPADGAKKSKFRGAKTTQEASVEPAQATASVPVEETLSAIIPAEESVEAPAPAAYEPAPEAVAFEVEAPEELESSAMDELDTEEEKEN